MGTVESGFMTKDLALCIHKSKYMVTVVWIVCALLQLLTAAHDDYHHHHNVARMERKHYLNTFEFLDKVEENLRTKLTAGAGDA